MRISDWSSDVCSSDLIEAAAVAERAAGLVAQEPACVQAVETVAGQRMHAVYPGVPAPARVLVADAVVAAFDIVVDRQRAPRQAIAEVLGAVVVPVAAARGRHVDPAAGGLTELAVAGGRVDS